MLQSRGLPPQQRRERMHWGAGSSADFKAKSFITWVVIKIMDPFWVP